MILHYACKLTIIICMLVLTIVRSSLAVVSYISKSVGDLVVAVVVGMVTGMVVGMVVKTVVGVVVGTSGDGGSSTLTFRGTVVTSLLAVICLSEPHSGVVQVAPINTAPGSPQTGSSNDDIIAPFLMLSVQLQE